MNSDILDLSAEDMLEEIELDIDEPFRSMPPGSLGPMPPPPPDRRPTLKFKKAELSALRAQCREPITVRAMPAVRG